MAISVKHQFESAVADGVDDTVVQPSDWNSEHAITLAGSTLLGRHSGTSGAAEEVALGSGLEFSAGTLRTALTGVLYALGSISGSVTLDAANGLVQTATLTGTTTFTPPTVAAGKTLHITLILTNGVSSPAIAIGGTYAWLHGAAPTFNTASSSQNLLVMRGTPSGYIVDGGPVG